MKERLAVDLSLTLGGQTKKIPGGDVRGFGLELTSYGAEGWVEFVVHDDKGHGGKYKDEILADFVKPDLAEVTIAIQAAHLDTTTKAADAAITTGGVILERWVDEEVYAGSTATPLVLTRRYRLSFADPARALWRQHFPCDLLTNKSFRDAIEAHKGAKISLTYDWEVITKEAPLVFFHLDPAAGASFYDLVLWFVRTRQGVFSFDHAKRTYSITKQKATDGEAAVLNREDVGALRSYFPEVPRHKPRVLDSYTEGTRSEVCDNAAAADGVFQDVLLRTPIAQQVDDRVTLEKARPLSRPREVRLGFRRFPTVSIVPGARVTISTKGGFSSELIAASEALRVFRLSIEARALDVGAEVDHVDTATGFELSLSAELETQSDARLRLPSSVDPRFPGYLEGKVVSEVGEDADITYDWKADEATSVEIYTVKIPLFADQKVNAPYEPYSGSGTLYLPLYKEQRVLVAFHFDRASILQLLDWRADARVPKDGQGQHLFLGKSAKSSTSVLHDYQDDKPVFRILRTNDKDTALLRIEEGRLTLKVEETKGS